MAVRSLSRTASDAGLAAAIASGDEIASQAVAEAGADNSKKMSALRTKQQIDARLTTQASAEAGVATTGLMNELRTKQSIDVNAELANYTYGDTDAVTRAINLRLQDEVSVKDFGTWTDSGNNSVLLQKAIDRVHAGGGARLIVPRGLCVVERQFNDGAGAYWGIEVKTGVRLVGAGRGITTLRLDAGEDATAIIKLPTGTEDASIEGMTIDGDRDEQNFSASLMGIRGGASMRRIAFKNLGIKNVYGRGLETNGDGELTDAFDSTISKDIVVDDVRCLDGGTKNIHVRRSSDVAVSNCMVDSLAVPDGAGPPVNSDNGSAFEASGARYVTFTNCHARHQTATWGVSLRAVNGSDHISFVNCMGRLGRQGVSIADASHVLVKSCQLIDNGSVGISVQSVNNDPAWADVVSVILEGNIVTNPTLYGVSASAVVSVDRLIAINNIIEGGANVMEYGLRISGSGVDAYEKGNLVSGATVADITGTWKAWGQPSGTWTPVLTFSTSAGDLNVVYSQQNGYYWIDGKILHWKAVVQTSTFTHTTATGDIRITGLPIASLSTANMRGTGSGSVRGITKASFTQFTPIAVQGTTTLGMRASGSGQVEGSVAVADMPSGGTVRFELSGWYPIA